jgi:hypothetical protein
VRSSVAIFEARRSFPESVEMWDWLARYPSVRIDQVGTPFEKGLDVENVASFDYIIVGGIVS